MTHRQLYQNHPFTPSPRGTVFLGPFASSHMGPDFSVCGVLLMRRMKEGCFNIGQFFWVFVFHPQSSCFATLANLSQDLPLMAYAHFRQDVDFEGKHPVRSKTHQCMALPDFVP